MGEIKEYENDMTVALAKRGLIPLDGRIMAAWAAAHVPELGLTETEAGLLTEYCRTGGEVPTSDEDGNLFLAMFSEAYCSWSGEKGSYVPAGVRVDSVREADPGTVCATALRQCNGQVRRLRRKADAEEPGEDRKTYEEELTYAEADRKTLRALAKRIRKTYRGCKSNEKQI